MYKKNANLKYKKKIIIHRYNRWTEKLKHPDWLITLKVSIENVKKWNYKWRAILIANA